MSINLQISITETEYEWKELFLGAWKTLASLLKQGTYTSSCLFIDAICCNLAKNMLSMHYILNNFFKEFQKPTQKNVRLANETIFKWPVLTCFALPANILLNVFFLIFLFSSYSSHFCHLNRFESLQSAPSRRDAGKKFSFLFCDFSMSLPRSNRNELNESIP